MTLETCNVMIGDMIEQYRAANYSVLPVRADGSKAPAVDAWDVYKQQVPSERDIQVWFGSGRKTAVGVGIICGQVSGGLAVLDFEFADFFDAWRELVEAEEPGLVEKLCVVKTPGKTAGGGRHAYLLYAGKIGTKKLARVTPEEAATRTGDKGKTTAIEIKGEGGYVLAPGCPPACHESGRTYEVVSERFPTPEFLTEEQVRVLLRSAMALSQVPGRVVEEASGSNGEARPGDEYNREESWGNILEPHGWVRVQGHGETEYWRRPGKDKGISATTGFCRTKRSGSLFYVFSTNAEPFEADRGYSKFSTFALLEHDGDWKTAAKALKKAGYGAALPATTKEATDGGEAEAEDAVPAKEPFPLDAFPDELQIFAEEVARANGCPVDLPAVAMLALAATAMGASRALGVTRSWVEGARMYLSVVSKPGKGKTPAIDAVSRPIVNYQSKLHADWEEKRRLFESESDSYESSKRKAIGSGGGFVPPKPKKPAYKHLYTTDSTTECLVPMLAENPRGMILLKDEITSWVLSMNQYKGGKGADRQFYLSAWSGQACKTDRKSTLDQGSVIVRHPFLSIFGGIQPDMLGELQDERGRQDGLVDRILFSFPAPGPCATEMGPPVSAEAEKTWEGCLEYLLRLEMMPTQDDGFRPRLVFLTDEAKKVATEWFRDHALERNADDFPRTLDGPWAKMTSYFYRLALVLHHLWLAAGYDVGENVDAHCVLSARYLINYFKSHCQHVYGQLYSTKEQRLAVELVEWIRQRGGKCSSRDLYRKRFGHDSKECDKLLRDLVGRGMGKMVEVPPSPQGGRPTKMFVLDGKE